jgi:hypothetical protein
MGQVILMRLLTDPFAFPTGVVLLFPCSSNEGIVIIQIIDLRNRSSSLVQVIFDIQVLKDKIIM